jgi:hypothetical protein
VSVVLEAAWKVAMFLGVTELQKADVTDYLMEANLAVW